jgi:outer membrane protein
MPVSKFLNKSVCISVITVACMSANVFAYEAGDFILRAGVASVQPEESSSGTVRLGVGNDEQLGITGVYMVTKNVGLELLAATPFTHDVTSPGLGKVATVKHLPPTFSVQYYFDTSSRFTPYLGAGINYWMVLESKGKGALANADVNVDDSIGLALSAGLDFRLTDNLILNAAIWNIDIDTEVDAAGNTLQMDLKVDPWVYMVGIGYKF